jgi:hypothetical protein
MCKEAFEGMYRSIHSKVVPNVAFVRSPTEMSVVGGIAMAYFNKVEEGAPPALRYDDMTDDVVTRGVCDAIGVVFPPSAIGKAPPQVTGASDAYNVYAPNMPDYRRIIRSFGLDEEYAKAEILKTSNLWQMGNWGAGDTAFLSFFKDVVNLPIDFSKYLDWEKATIHGCLRVVHERFVVVSDFPAELKQEVQPNGTRQPHCVDGPHLRWRDGSEEYAVHGISIPAWVFRRPQDITPDNIMAEGNAEVRRVMIDQYGPLRFAQDSGLVVVDEQLDELGLPVQLLRKDVPDDEPIVVVKLTNSTLNPDGTRRTYLERVPPTFTNALAARNWGSGMPDDARYEVQT